MRKLLLMFALVVAAVAARAQEISETPTQDETAVSQPAAKPQPSTGDLFDGLTRPLTFERMVAPYALEVTFAKTVHILFPSAIRYVDLGSADLLAAKADGTENVLRVKSAVKGFTRESNLAVITEDGAYYSFNVKYADEPVKLSVEMADFLDATAKTNRSNNALPIYLKELGDESPRIVRQIMRSIYKDNRREIKSIRSKSFGTEYLLKGIYTHNGLLYFHTQLTNESNIPFDVDYITFKVVDKKVAKRTAIQERIIQPLRTHNDVTQIDGRSTECSVFVLSKFTIPDGKRLVIELAEQDGGRNHTLKVSSSDLLKARTIKKLK